MVSTTSCSRGLPVTLSGKRFDISMLMFALPAAIALSIARTSSCKALPSFLAVTEHPANLRRPRDCTLLWWYNPNAVREAEAADPVLMDREASIHAFLGPSRSGLVHSHPTPCFGALRPWPPHAPPLSV